MVLPKQDRNEFDLVVVLNVNVYDKNMKYEISHIHLVSHIIKISMRLKSQAGP